MGSFHRQKCTLDEEWEHANAKRVDGKRLIPEYPGWRRTNSNLRDQRLQVLSINGRSVNHYDLMFIHLHDFLLCITT